MVPIRKGKLRIVPANYLYLIEIMEEIIIVTDKAQELL